MPPTFTTLPREIRNEIYSNIFGCAFYMLDVLSSGKFLTLNPHSQEWVHKYHLADPQIVLALLSVNHQISDEVAPLFYGKQTLRTNWCDILPFLKGIGPRRRGLITSVHIFGWGYDEMRQDCRETFDLLDGITDLRTVRIESGGLNLARYQSELIEFGILKLAGKVDIGVYNNFYKSRACGRHLEGCVWSCTRGSTEWTHRELDPSTENGDQV